MTQLAQLHLCHIARFGVRQPCRHKEAPFQCCLPFVYSSFQGCVHTRRYRFIIVAQDKALFSCHSESAGQRCL